MLPVAEDTLCNNNDCYGVSLNLKGGGCAGFEYDWGTVTSSDEVKPLDITIDAGDGKFVIGNESMMFLFGTKIDYKKDGLNNLKFKLVKTVMFTDNCKMYNVTL